MRLPANWLGPAALLGAAVIWGFVPASTRYVIRTLTPEQIVLSRFLFGSVAVLLAMAVLRPPMPERRYLPRAVFFGLLGTLGFNVPLSFGLRHIEAGTAALINATSPIFTVVLAALVLGEPLRPRIGIGLMLALAGSVVVAAGSGGRLGMTREQLGGSLLVLTASFVWGVYSVSVKPWLGTIPASSIPMVGTLAGLPLLAPFALSGYAGNLRDLTSIGWVALLQFSVAAAVIAPILFAVGLQRGHASRAGMYGYLPPVFGVVISAVLLGEAVGPATALGGAMILAGVLLATLNLRPRAEPVATGAASD